MQAGACLICGGAEHSALVDEPDCRILRCRRCGHLFSERPPAPDYDGFWDGAFEDDTHFYWKSARRRMFDEFIEMFVAGKSGRLLDVGCGLGFFVEAVSRQPGWTAYGCEVSPAAVRYARESLHLPHITCGRPDQAGLPPASFDIVTLWDVLDHLTEPDPFLRQCHDLLSPSGMCFIRVPNIRVQLARARIARLLGTSPSLAARLQPRDHAHHYSATSLRTLLARNGFGDTRFVHLRPVEDVAGAKRWLKNLSFEAVKAIAALSGNRLNLDNLFVVATKSSRPPHA